MAAHAIPELDRSGLRRFGLTTGAIVAVLFGLFFPWLLDFRIPTWPWIVLAVLGGWAIVAPQSLNPVYKGWMRFGLVLNRITTPIIMGVVFFLIFMPFGFVMRVFGKDPLNRRFSQSAKSYRIPSSKPEPDSLGNPF